MVLFCLSLTAFPFCVCVFVFPFPSPFFFLCWCSPLPPPPPFGPCAPFSLFFSRFSVSLFFFFRPFFPLRPRKSEQTRCACGAPAEGRPTWGGGTGWHGKMPRSRARPGDPTGKPVWERTPGPRPRGDCILAPKKDPVWGPLSGPGIGGQKSEGQQSALTLLSADFRPGKWDQIWGRLSGPKSGPLWGPPTHGKDACILSGMHYILHKMYHVLQTRNDARDSGYYEVCHASDMEHT